MDCTRGYHIHQRLSLKGQLCTVRYIGPVADKSGEWLGVEWDEPERGKHDGKHEGVRYFSCRNRSSTAASFLRSKQAWDKPRSFLQALRAKYMPDEAQTGGEIVYFSSKKAEEVGFEKFAKRQAQLHGIHVVVLDYMRISGGMTDLEKREVTEICSHITELDLGSNLFETLADILEITILFPRLTRLILDGNRFEACFVPDEVGLNVFRNVRTLGVSNTLLAWSEIVTCTDPFPALLELSAGRNGLDFIGPDQLPGALERLLLPDNGFVCLSHLNMLSSCHSLKYLGLKRCRINAVWSNVDSTSKARLNQNLQFLDVSYNEIATWFFFDDLVRAHPTLRHLHVGGNPLYKDLRSADDKPLTSADGYMLTIARAPHLETLNYSTITEKERLNAEVYYLGQIATELAKVPEAQAVRVLSRHPRWTALCEEYGKPTIQRSSTSDALSPNSLAARLVAFEFVLGSTTLPDLRTREWTEEIPRSFNVYTILGMVGKKLEVMPLNVRLVWETGERDPAGKAAGYAGPEWWDSSDEEGESSPQDGRLVAREVELVPGTRAIGTYIEGMRARIRVELRTS